ncbi:hypothetical protein E1B42_24000 [Salmonella enterica subsp. enterica serovar Agona]|uniref:Uncharacterized protein n=2 Tax=Salmonella enterica TaxID=28901 RepID=A0A6V9ZPZ3_SALER|nr:hypothetical protein SCH_167 [Salmonella enterica subsp. enterica serovar Choleraesuis str. SC-B67]AZW02468.1 hypothetical protein ENE68_23725 [Escherichia coli]EAM7392207.1 hypothetical protein [Salmonella enterica]EAW2293434.1 hypothetical protein [Salmonella enterica subsp. enterica]EAW3905838.1 hypothetical protein [Salmonella enterica subsp. enterica serovar Choleraesuis]EBG0094962.1 hypothetical protein [Salmonella enterica subsp. enterica serovar Agona]ECB6723062.1 hypothetical prot
MVLANHMQVLSAFQSRSERYTVILIRCDPSDNLMTSLRSACCCITNGALWLQLSKSEGVNAKQKCHPRCETEMSCFGSENAFDRLAIYFRAFSFPNRNHENDNFLVYNLVYKAIA